MYTSCPGCKLVYRITVKQLRAGRGELFCQDCHIIFNALNTLSETLGEVDSPVNQRSNPPMLTRKDVASAASRYEAEVEDDIPARKDGRSPGFFEGLAFALGSMALIAAFLVQLAAFEGAQMAQNPWIRPLMSQACEKLGCNLPDFKALDHIKTSEKTLRVLPEEIDGYEFKAILINQAALPQAFPGFKLVLTDSESNPIAERLFKPQDYLTDKEMKLLAVGKPFEIRLLLAKPGKAVQGFKFKLI